jgi:hypothetical protein
MSQEEEYKLMTNDYNFIRGRKYHFFWCIIFLLQKIITFNFALSKVDIWF